MTKLEVNLQFKLIGCLAPLIQACDSLIRETSHTTP